MDTMQAGEVYCFPFDWENAKPKEAATMRETLRDRGIKQQKGSKWNVIQGYDDSNVKCFIVKRVK